MHHDARPSRRRYIATASTWLPLALLAGCSLVPRTSDTRGSQPFDERQIPSERSTRDLSAEYADSPYPLDFGQRLDRAHDWMYIKGQELVESTDMRFAPKDRELLPVPATPFRLGIEGEAIDRSGSLEFNAELDLDVTLRLPNIERRLRIFITSDDIEESPNRGIDEDRSIRAGFRFDLPKELDFDIGLRADLPPVAFTSLRWARNYFAGDWTIYPFSKVYLETEDGFGVASGITFGRWVRERWGLRSSTYANWRKDEDATEWSQALLLARAEELIEERRFGSVVRGRDLARGFGVQLLASGERTSEVTYYEASLLFKRPARGRWLYWYIEPLVRWDREYDWNADPGFRIGLDALFWDLSRRGSRLAPAARVQEPVTSR